MRREAIGAAFAVAALVQLFRHRSSLVARCKALWEGDTEAAERARIVENIRAIKGELKRLEGAVSSAETAASSLSEEARRARHQDQAQALQAQEQTQAQAQRSSKADAQPELNTTESQNAAAASGYYHFASDGTKHVSKWDDFDVDEELKRLDDADDDAAEGGSGGAAARRHRAQQLRRLRRVGELRTDAANCEKATFEVTKRCRSLRSRLCVRLFCVCRCDNSWTFTKNHPPRSLQPPRPRARRPRRCSRCVRPPPELAASACRGAIFWRRLLRAVPRATTRREEDGVTGFAPRTPLRFSCDPARPSRLLPRLAPNWRRCWTTRSAAMRASSPLAVRWSSARRRSSRASTASPQPSARPPLPTTPPRQAALPPPPRRSPEPPTNEQRTHIKIHREAHPPSECGDWDTGGGDEIRRRRMRARAATPPDVGPCSRRNFISRAI